jgi:hypothetical protein
MQPGTDPANPNNEMASATEIKFVSLNSDYDSSAGLGLEGTASFASGHMWAIKCENLVEGEALKTFSELKSQDSSTNKLAGIVGGTTGCGYYDQADADGVDGKTWGVKCSNPHGGRIRVSIAASTGTQQKMLTKVVTFEDTATCTTAFNTAGLVSTTPPDTSNYKAGQYLTFTCNPGQKPSQEKVYCSKGTWQTATCEQDNGASTAAPAMAALAVAAFLFAQQ